MKTTVHVTRHALRRYLERACEFEAPAASDEEALLEFERQGVNLELVKERLAAEAALSARMGCKTHKLPGGNRMVLNGRCAVTVLPPFDPPAHTPRIRQRHEVRV